MRLQRLKPTLPPMNGSDSNSFSLKASKNKWAIFSNMAHLFSEPLVRASREKITSNMTAFIGGKLGFNFCLVLFLLLFTTSFAFANSPLAHLYLDGLFGLEIGGSAHNSFNLNTLNVDYTDDYTTVYKQEELRLVGHYMKVDIVAPGDDLPFKDNTVDFVVSSHVIEHFYDPIKAVKEWLRVVKPGGYIYIIAPHKMRTFDRDRPRTTLAELLERHKNPIDPALDDHHHWSVWITQDFLELCIHMNWPVINFQDVDDKVGNGFAIVIQKPYN